MLFPVLLAGGIGSRLAPLSSLEFPKQFFRLPGYELSMFQLAAEEAQSFAPIGCIICKDNHAARVMQELEEINFLPPQMILEPVSCGTAFAMCVMALYAASCSPDAVLWALPCDHIRSPSLGMKQQLPRAIKLAEQGKLVLLGIPPSSADSGFGYIISKEDTVSGAMNVERFIEKPSAEKALEFMREGNVYWNSGMFIVRADVVIKLMGEHAQHILAAAEAALLNATSQNRATLLDKASYEGLQSEAFDTAILEKMPDMALLPLMAEGWTEMGTWPRLLAWWEKNAPAEKSWDFGEGKKVERVVGGAKNLTRGITEENWKIDTASTPIRAAKIIHK